MAEGKHCEIELKYLIRYPDLAALRAQPGCKVWEIEQIWGEERTRARIKALLI